MPNAEAEVYNNNKWYDLKKKKKKTQLKTSIRFHGANKIDNYHRGD